MFRKLHPQNVFNAVNVGVSVDIGFIPECRLASFFQDEALHGPDIVSTLQSHVLGHSCMVVQSPVCGPTFITPWTAQTSRHSDHAP